MGKIVAICDDENGRHRNCYENRGFSMSRRNAVCKKCSSEIAMCFKRIRKGFKYKSTKKDISRIEDFKETDTESLSVKELKAFYTKHGFVCDEENDNGDDKYMIWKCVDF